MLEVWILVYALIGSAHGYPNGAPPDACATMTPIHGAGPQTDPPPYSLTVSSDTYKPGDTITVTLSVTSPKATFKGFLVKVRSKNDDVTDIGELMIVGADSQNACNKTAVTHTQSSPKLNETFSWSAPAMNAGEIVFEYTVVYDKLTFWKQLTSLPVKFSDDNDGGSNSSSSLSSRLLSVAMQTLSIFCLNIIL